MTKLIKANNPQNSAAYAFGLGIIAFVTTKIFSGPTTSFMTSWMRRGYLG
jgi:hypothetical protein